MADPTYQIDELDFHSLTGPVVAPAHDVRAVSRAGVEGHSFWLCGLHGKEQEFTSVRDAIDVEEAQSLLDSYRELIEREPVDYRWAGKDMPFRIKVIMVEPLPDGLHAIVHASGGREQNPQAMLRARWVVIPVPIEAEEEEE